MIFHKHRSDSQMCIARSGAWLVALVGLYTRPLDTQNYWQACSLFFRVSNILRQAEQKNDAIVLPPSIIHLARPQVLDSDENESMRSGNKKKKYNNSALESSLFYFYLWK